MYRQNVRVPNWFGQQLKMIANGEQQSIGTVADRRGYLNQLKSEKVALRSHLMEKKLYLKVGMINNNQKNYRCQNSL